MGGLGEPSRFLVLGAIAQAMLLLLVQRGWIHPGTCTVG